MLTAKAAVRAIGRKGELPLGGDTSITVHVRDVRQVWGRTDLLVAPVAGSGEMWVSAGRVSLYPEEVSHG